MQTIKEAVEKTVENYLNTDKFRDKSPKDDLELSFGQLIEKTIKEALENGFKLGVEFAQQWISVEDELPISGTQFLLKDENGNIYIGCYIEEIRAFRPYGAKGKAGGITHWRLININ